jgi:hypothetical protein
MIERFNIALSRNGIQHLAGVLTIRPSRVVIVMSPGLEYHDISSSVRSTPSSAISVNNYDNFSGHIMYYHQNIVSLKNLEIGIISCFWQAKTGV